MPRFFIEPTQDDIISVRGGDAFHLVNSLRMKKGDSVTLCDGAGTLYNCTIVGIGGNAKTSLEVRFEVKGREEANSEPSVKLTLFQALPKGGKMETIVQKAVELGVKTIVPFLPFRSVSRPDEKSWIKKQERYNKIALEAAMQSGRDVIPVVEELCGFKDVLNRIRDFDKAIFCYENGGESLTRLVNGGEISIGIIIGNEGGFEDFETEQIAEAGGLTATLGERVLRCETAPICAVSAILVLTGNM